MRILLVLMVTVLLTTPGVVDAQSSESLYPDNQELNNLKNRYRRCVLGKAEKIYTISDFATAMEYAPIACKRDFLSIRMFYLRRGAFDAEISADLLNSVKAGIEIDAVNHLISFAEKRK